MTLLLLLACAVEPPPAPVLETCSHDDTEMAVCIAFDEDACACRILVYQPPGTNEVCMAEPGRDAHCWQAQNGHLLMDGVDE